MNETKLHYKMFKSGKQWVIVGITASTLFIFGSSYVAKADSIKYANKSTDEQVSKLSSLKDATILRGERHQNSLREIERLKQIAIYQLKTVIISSQ